MIFDNNSDFLYINRYEGTEVYSVSDAFWQLLECRPSNLELYLPYASDDHKEILKSYITRPEHHERRLFFSIFCDAVTQLEDSAYTFRNLNLEISYLTKNLKIEALTKGFKVKQTDENKEDFETNIYTCTHESTSNNCIEIIERKEDDLKVKLQFSIDDDACKDSPSRIAQLTAWFKHEKSLKIASSWMGNENDIAILPD
ncbi:MAG: hypothetical protein IV090_22340 [Candidatus Sericytochromatia bacterium]|nr:hypothetical protein [Candidatus Sericytochromatia bacterium]